MNSASALCVVATVVGLLVAILSRRFGSAPGWGRYRALAAVGVTAAAYSALDATWTTDAPRSTLELAMCLQGCVAALHVAAWQTYVRRHLGIPLRRRDAAVTALLLVIAVLWLVPGLLGGGHVVVVPMPWLGATYRLLDANAGGTVAYALTTALLGVPFLRYLRAARKGVPDARLHALALGAIFVAAVNDTLLALEVIRAPMLLSFGFVVAVGALGYALTRAFVSSARELERLSRSLEQLVADRTRALVAAEASLLKTEKMAALGQLATGVAHEINNPAAAVEANLTYLREALDAGSLPHDARECLDESLEAVARIARIVGQLLDAGRSPTSAAPAGSGTASVQLAVEEALMASRPHVGDHITTSVDLSSALYVRADAPSLVQVLVNLITNAAQAIPSERGHGHVRIRTANAAGRIAIQVIDDGTGMSDETQRRLFEPFFTTKPMAGTGLGLAASLGLLRSMGGDLEVRSSPGSTCMTILLDPEL